MADHKIIFSMERVSKTFPGASKKVLNNIWLSFYYGAKIGVLGLNGSGKSTLLKIIAGVDKNYEGNVVFDADYKIGYLAQEPELQAGKTVRQIVEEAVQETVDLMKEYDEVNLKFAEPMSDDEMNALIARQAELMEELETRNAWELDNKLNTALDALRCPPDDAVVDHLSGGERRRVALARLLLSDPDILLLDEPTNHLDAESVHWLEQYLRSFPGTVIAVTHDRYFLDNVAGWILELDLGGHVPGVRRVDLLLEPRHLLHQLVGVVLCELHRDRVELVDLPLQVPQAFGCVLVDGLRLVELRLLGQVAYGGAVGDVGLAGELGVHARHDLQQGRLARPVDPDDADLGVAVELQVDVIEDLLGAVGLGQPRHVKDELACHGIAPDEERGT